MNIADQDDDLVRADERDRRPSLIHGVRVAGFFPGHGEAKFVIRETQQIPILERSPGGDPGAVEVTAVETPQVEDPEAVFLFPDHGVTTAHPGIVDHQVAFRGSSNHQNIEKVHRFPGLNAGQDFVHV